MREAKKAADFHLVILVLESYHTICNTVEFKECVKSREGVQSLLPGGGVDLFDATVQTASGRGDNYKESVAGCVWCQSISLLLFWKSFDRAEG